jgi:hypothetical protein
MVAAGARRRRQLMLHGPPRCRRRLLPLLSRPCPTASAARCRRPLRPPPRPRPPARLLPLFERRGVGVRKQPQRQRLLQRDDGLVVLPVLVRVPRDLKHRHRRQQPVPAGVGGRPLRQRVERVARRRRQVARREVALGSGARGGGDGGRVGAARRGGAWLQGWRGRGAPPLRRGLPRAASAPTAPLMPGLSACVPQIPRPRPRPRPPHLAVLVPHHERRDVRRRLHAPLRGVRLGRLLGVEHRVRLGSLRRGELRARARGGGGGASARRGAAAAAAAAGVLDAGASALAAPGTARCRRARARGRARSRMPPPATVITRPSAPWRPRRAGPTSPGALSLPSTAGPPAPPDAHARRSRTHGPAIQRAPAIACGGGTPGAGRGAGSEPWRATAGRSGRSRPIYCGRPAAAAAGAPRARPRRSTEPPGPAAPSPGPAVAVTALEAV